MIKCTRRCQVVAGTFQPSVLVPAILVCRNCGQPRRREQAPAAPPLVAPAAPMGRAPCPWCS